LAQVTCDPEIDVEDTGCDTADTFYCKSLSLRFNNVNVEWAVSLGVGVAIEVTINRNHSRSGKIGAGQPRQGVRRAGHAIVVRIGARAGWQQSREVKAKKCTRWKRVG
jgi:hypothetical protein